MVVVRSEEKERDWRADDARMVNVAAIVVEDIFIGWMDRWLFSPGVESQFWCLKGKFYYSG